MKINTQIVPRKNIAPSEAIPAVLNDGKRELNLVKWGFIPSWVKDRTKFPNLINARADSLTEKPAFKNAYQWKRCLIVADGFYEWKKIEKKKSIPYFIKMKDGQPFTFAGLWDVWKDENGTPSITTTIITTEPNSLIEPIHNRMPVIVPESSREIWLSPEPASKFANEFKALWTPYPDKEMEIWEQFAV